jgi:phosphoglycerate dehydrogenase-like enzyme
VQRSGCVGTDELAVVAADVEVLLAFRFAGRAFPRDAVLGLPHLRWVQLASAGCDHMLPYDAARLCVTTASGIHRDATAEYVLGTLVHMLRDFPRLAAQQRRHHWEKFDVPTLSGRTMRIIGAGHVLASGRVLLECACSGYEESAGGWRGATRRSDQEGSITASPRTWRDVRAASRSGTW